MEKHYFSFYNSSNLLYFELFEITVKNDCQIDTEKCKRTKKYYQEVINGIRTNFSTACQVKPALINKINYESDKDGEDNKGKYNPNISEKGEELANIRHGE